MSQKKDWEKLLKKIEDFLAENRDKHYIFRGQDRYTSQIRSALHRKIYGKKTPREISDNLASLSLENPLESAENKLFYQMGSRFFPGQDKEKVLAQLQHLGEPTNFIDFTDDHLVALFFACFSTDQGKEEEEENNPVIYFYKCDSSTKSDSRTDQTSGTREGIFRSASRNNRIIAQRSCFIYQENGTLGTDIPRIEVEKDIENKEFFCLEIKKEWRQHILDYLEKKNIKYLYLFNDLEGHVRYRSSYEPLTVLKEQFFHARNNNKDAKAISLLEKIAEHNQEEAVNFTILFITNLIEHFSLEIDDFNKIIPEEKKRSAMFYFLRGMIYRLQTNNVEKELADYSKAIELKLDFYLAYFYRGLLYAEQKEYDKALKDYDKAIELNPDDYEAYNNRGNLYRKGEFEKALKDYSKAIELKPDFHLAYFNRGNLYREKGEFEKALRDYDKAIELKPDSYEAYFNRGSLYDEKREYDKALKNYNKAIELNSHYYEAYNNRGNLYKEKREYEEALKDYDKAIELNPDYYEAYFNRSVVYLIQGKFKEALKDCNKALEFKPDDDDARKLRAYLLKRIKEEEADKN